MVKEAEKKIPKPPPPKDSGGKKAEKKAAIPPPPEDTVEKETDDAEFYSLHYKGQPLPDQVKLTMVEGGADETTIVTVTFEL